jgi:hypothetical protein
MFLLLLLYNASITAIYCSPFPKRRSKHPQSEFSDALKHTKLSPLARVLLWTHNTIIFSRFYTFLNAEFEFVPQPVGQMVRSVPPLVSQFEVRERLAEQKFLEEKNQ